MNRFVSRLILGGLIAGLAGTISISVAQQRGGFGGFGGGGPGGPGGPGGGVQRELVAQFDENGDGWLNQAERVPARAEAIAGASQGGRGGPGGGRGGRGGPGGGRGGASEPATEGPVVTADQVTSYPDHELYDTSVLRTMFLEFDNDDWEIELENFHGTDVDVPAKLTVDGKVYPNVGVRFRGASSYGHVQRGSKRSLNLSMDTADEDQRLYGYKSLNLLNSHGDPTMMSTVVYSHIARQYVAAPKANFVHVVVNGRSWGLYDNVQQFDKTFLKENFKKSKGTRWKVSGSPSADGGLRYLGDDLADYESRFEMKSSDGLKEWDALIELCKTLNETPSDQLVAALDPILDIDATLKFLALDVVLVNSDGYWTRASDYSLFRDKDGLFRPLPHDMNEAFAVASHGGPGGGGRGGPGGAGQAGRPGEGRPGDAGGQEDRPGGRRGEGRPEDGVTDGQPRGELDDVDIEREFEAFLSGRGQGGFGRGAGGPGGPGGGPGGRGGPGGGGPGHGGVDLDPLIGLDSDRMPLRSKLLAVPELRQRYMGYVNQIATESLDWNKLGPVVEGYRDLVEPLVKQDTRRLSSYEAFQASTRSGESAEAAPMSLYKFAHERSKFLTSAE